jgi:hypothetical protein
MIIPSMLASQVKRDISGDTDSDDDGLSPEERENIRSTLAKLSAGFTNGEIKPAGGTIPRPQSLSTTPSISQVLGGTPSDIPVPAKAPPQVRAVATPIAVPSNGPPLPPAAEASLPVEAGEKPKKMSRFKARQLGLE